MYDIAQWVLEDLNYMAIEVIRDRRDRILQQQIQDILHDAVITTRIYQLLDMPLYLLPWGP